MNENLRSLFGTGYEMSHDTPSGPVSHDEFISDEAFRSLTEGYFTSDAKRARKGALLLKKMGCEQQKFAADMFLQALEDEYARGAMDACRAEFQKNAAQNLTGDTPQDSLLSHETASAMYRQGIRDAQRALEVADPVEVMASWPLGL